VLRLLSPLDADGPTQMAWDEALLEQAGGPTLRLYRWTPPCVSLGYFQDYASATAGLPAAMPTGMPVVRRITGGGAIWHEHEVTYALVGRLGHQGLPGRTAELYPRLHGAVLAQLARCAPQLREQAATVGDRRYAAEPRCFASPAAADLVHAAGGKVLGSAARARGERVLLHGSLKLASNPWDGAAVAGCGLDAAAAGEALVAGIATALGLEPRPDAPTAAETAAMQRIRDARYGDAAWVRERRGPRA
jgi:lipoyl(octanoyl) transferase